LSPSDGITIVAGQNESGKSSLLEALMHYEEGTPCLDAYRNEEELDAKPSVICIYTLEKDFDLYNELSQLNDPNARLAPALKTEEFSYFLKKISQRGTIQLARFIGSSKENKYPIVYQHDIELSIVLKKLKEKEEFQKLSEIDLRILLGTELFRLAPKIILFNEFFDILPDKFYLSDLDGGSKAKGWQAVKNVETILDTNFSTLATASARKITMSHRDYEAKLTADFNERWRQRIGDESGAVISVTFHQGGIEGKPYLSFFIETRKGELLSPEKRSMGFKWFLSFYLHLTAEDKRNSNLILLFDEPGLHLHSKAQYDMLRVFEELSQKNQIIYATHSPYLIDTSKLHRVRLVFNSKDAGTTIEKITTNLSENQKDAIKPIIDALGLSVAHDFSAAKKRNVIVEGISDYYYLTAAKKLCGVEQEFYFMPAMGSPNAHLLMELCIGWGLEWLMIFDEKGSSKDVRKIKTQFFPHDPDINTKIHTLKGCDGIEDIFEEEDIKLASPGFVRTAATLSKDLSSHGGKELIGRFFLDKVESGEITLDKLSEKAKNHFQEVFAFIEKGF
jgi:hypothetical protein